MEFGELKNRHNQTMLDFAKKFNDSPVAPNVVFIVSVAETGLADAVIVDMNMRNKEGAPQEQGMLAVDWECLGTVQSFKGSRVLKQQERKLKDWTDCAFQINGDGKEVAVAFTTDWLKAPKETITFVNGDRDSNGKPIRDEHGKWRNEKKIPVDVRYTSQFGVWHTKDIDSLKLFIAAALEKGLKDKEAFGLFGECGAHKSGHVYIPSNLSSLKEKFTEPEFAEDQHYENVCKFADQFNGIEGWNAAMSNIILHPVPCPNGEYDAMFINLDNNTKMLVKFDESISWDDPIMFDELYVQQFKGVVADALGAGYEAPVGFYPDIERQLQQNKAKGMYTSHEHEQLDRVRLYSIKNAEPFINQTLLLKNAFTINVRDADVLYDKIQRDTSNMSLDELINFSSPTAGRPKKAWDSFSSLSPKVKKKQKDLKKDVLKSKGYLERQKQLLTQRKDDLLKMPKFSKKKSGEDR